MQKLLSKREITILYLTLGVILTSFIFNFLFAPFLKMNASLNNAITLTKLKLTKYLILQSKQNYLRSTYAAVASQGSQGQGSQDSVVASLAELENLAQSCAIRIFDIRPQPPSIQKQYKEILIEMRTEGSLEDYVRFIYSLENSLSLLRVKRFQLNALANNLSLEGNFTISKLSLSE